MSPELIFAEALGNKFIIIDNKKQSLSINADLIDNFAQQFSFDQFIVIKKFTEPELYITIYNRDGSEAQACGNAFRCLSLLVYEQFKCSDIKIINQFGNVFPCRYIDSQNIEVTFPIPRFDWQEIPLAKEQGFLDINLPEFKLANGGVVNVGNPHLLFKLESLDLDFLKAHGEKIISNPLFPERINLSLIQIINKQHIKIITYERGAGITQACGSGALASAIFISLQHGCDAKTTVEMLGGSLQALWAGYGHPAKIIGSAEITKN